MTNKTENSMDSVGNRLRELRRHLDKSQAEMGRLLGLKKSTFSKYEIMESAPSLKLLHMMATRFNASLDYLVCGRGTLFWGQDETADGRETAEGELAELLDLMGKVPMVRHSVLSYFQKLKFENRDLIDQHLSRDQAQE